jgi:hypothetical protein
MDDNGYESFNGDGVMWLGEESPEARSHAFEVVYDSGGPELPSRARQGARG